MNPSPWRGEGLGRGWKPRVIIVPKDLPVNTLPEFVAYLKANQGRMQFASAGAGSASRTAS